MSSQEKPSAPVVSSSLPAYISGATPNPASNRAPWYKNTAPTYAGIFLWFVFWQDAVNAPSQGGLLACGLGWALASLVVAALVCHYLFYLAPGLLGMKTGLPLYIVGTSTFGATGGFILPGFLMGLLQFGWLGVNIYFSSQMLAAIGVNQNIIMVVWGLLAAFVGLKGIQYVAKVATFLPLIPLGILLYLFAVTAGGLGSFTPDSLIESQKALAPKMGVALGGFGVLAFMLAYVVGFFATAGAAGVDFGTNSVDGKDVNRGGLFGIALAIVLTAGLSILIVAGAHGTKDFHANAVKMAQAAVDKEIAVAKDGLGNKGAPAKKDVDAALVAAEPAINKAVASSTLSSPSLFGAIVGTKTAGILMFLLAISAFPSACFSSFIAANSFKTTLPGVNPFITVGIGAAISILLAITGWAGDAIKVFNIIGASFGPICGAMTVDYLIHNKTWTGPRKGFNPAGWIAWALGFTVGILPIVSSINVPAAPVLAYVVGAAAYFVCAKAGLLSDVIPMPKKQA